MAIASGHSARRYVGHKVNDEQGWGHKDKDEGGGVGWLLSLRAEVEDGGERELGNGERCHDIGVEDGRDSDPSASYAIGTDLQFGSGSECEARRRKVIVEKMGSRRVEFSAELLRIQHIQSAAAAAIYSRFALQYQTHAHPDELGPEDLLDRLCATSPDPGLSVPG